MNPQLRFRPARRAFTLVELLVVIGIIAVLAALLFPALAGGTTRARVRKAQIEIGELVQAIQSYHRTYSRYPLSNAYSSNAMNCALGGQEGGDPLPQDFTFGTHLASVPVGVSPIVNGYGTAAPYEANNSEVMLILMDIIDNPVNAQHLKNPQQIKFLQTKMTDGLNRPGVGPDRVYRDPWGKPYIISMDLNYDEKCWDAVYRLQSVSQKAANNPAGFHGLFNEDLLKAPSRPNHFAFNGGVMVWSMGPDGVWDTGPADDAANKDNILSWK